MAKFSKVYELSQEELQELCDSHSTLKQIEQELHVAHKTLVARIKELDIDLTKLKSNRYVRYDLTGQKYGRLTVLKLDEDNNDRIAHWLCLCDCGNIVSVEGGKLKNGHTQSCGCRKIEKLIQRTKKYNVYDLSLEYGVGYTTNTNAPFYFDKEDYDKIKDYAWRDNGCGYLGSYDGTNKKIILMHRLLMPCDDELVVDHINHNRMDNRKQNLRICTSQQNSCNMILRKNNTSGHQGVVWYKNTNKWVARIIYKGKEINLGYYENYLDAVTKREEAEIKYFGDYRYKGDD